MHKEELFRSDIFLVHEFFSPDECRHYIWLSESAGYDDAPINAGAAGQIIRKDVRNNDRVMVDDRELAETFWQRAKPFIPETIGGWHAVGLNERLRFYRYDPGQRFSWHFDGAFERSPLEQSHLTFMVYLNDDFEGGETQFNPKLYGRIQDSDSTFQVKPVAGTLLVFTHRVLHQGATVTKGRKYVLRSDVMYRHESADRHAIE